VVNQIMKAINNSVVVFKILVSCQGHPHHVFTLRLALGMNEWIQFSRNRGVWIELNSISQMPDYPSSVPNIFHCLKWVFIISMNYSIRGKDWRTQTSRFSKVLQALQSPWLFQSLKRAQQSKSAQKPTALKNRYFALNRLLYHLLLFHNR
jgi:hypothetical protein